MHWLATFTSSLLVPSLVWAAALPSGGELRDVRIEPVDISRRQGVSTLSSSALSAITPFIQFARAAYCPSSKIQNWSCGQACDALPGVDITLTGGDGNSVQLFFVGYWSDQNSIVVAHEGTDPVAFLSDLTGIKFFKKDFDQTLFPGIDAAVEGHDGFVDEHAKTASTILAEVKRLISSKNAATVLCIGHSLGGALAELDSLFFTMNLPSSIHVKGVTFGTPRVGNAQYAAFFDSQVPDFQRVNHDHDPIPIVPGRFLGFSHVHGEVHLSDNGPAVACLGDDDSTDSQCSIKAVPNIIESNILDHLGPYEGIHIGTLFCT
ncbi:alpha/beta-hydrolase [Trametopsis cervina]|nr:alpha/beta-hydrolase [Trametopsis cervina]